MMLETFKVKKFDFFLKTARIKVQKKIHKVYKSQKYLQFYKLSIEFGLFRAKQAIIHKNRLTNDELIHHFILP